MSRIVAHEVIDLAAEQRGHGRRVAAVRNERRLRGEIGIEDERVGERHRADAGMGEVELVGIRLHIGDELSDVLRRKILAGGDQQRLRDDDADRLEIGLGLVGEIGIERHRDRVRAHVAHLDGVAVRRGAHGAGRADGAAGADDVLDHDLLAERAGHVLAGDAGGDVGRAAGRERHDQGDRPRRIGLGHRGARESGNSRRRGKLQEIDGAEVSSWAHSVGVFAPGGILLGRVGAARRRCFDQTTGGPHGRREYAMPSSAGVPEASRRTGP